MSLLKQKKENDRVAAEVAAKAEKEAILHELAIHPALKADCSRDVRDAYFYGLVFAAIADDEKVDAGERAILDGVAKSMGLDEGDVDETISLIAKMASPNDKLQLIEECVSTIKDRESIVKLFYAQFVGLWVTGEYDIGELKEYLGMFKGWTGVELTSVQMKDIKTVDSNHVAPEIGRGLGQFVDEGLLDALCRVVQSGRDFNRDDLLKLSDWLGEDATRYLMLDVFEDDVKPILDAHRTMLANRAALPAKLVEIIESDATWPVEFKPADYQPLFDAAGIPEADAGTFVARELLPFMKRACEVAKTKIDEVEVVHDNDEYNGAKFETVKEFRALFRCAFFVDAFVDLNSIYKKYYFVGHQEEDHKYYLPSLTLHEDHITFKRIGPKRFERVEPLLCPGSFSDFPHVLFDRMRCGWSIYDDDAKRYFAQWEELFAAIEKRFVVNNPQDSGTAIQG